jgi:hypothetical protein
MIVGYVNMQIWHTAVFQYCPKCPLYPIRANSFVSIIMYLTCTIIVLLKKYMVWHIFLHLMFRKPNKTTINKNKMTNLYRSTSFRISFMFLNIWILTFYCFKTRFYLFLGFRVSNHWWAFQSLFSLSKLPSNHSTVAIQLYAIINIFDSWYQQEKNIQDTIKVFQIWHNLCSVLKVKIDFEKPISGSRHESPKINKNAF